MSFFSTMFGGKKETTKTTGEVIQNLRETENMLIKKQEYLEKKIEQEIEVAKKNVSKNKRVAIQALKRKKRFENELRKLDGTLSTIEMQRETLEDANTNTAVLANMKSAADALKIAHQNLDTDKIHDIMDEISEQQDLSREISEAISTSIGGQDYDLDELEKELEDLEQEELDKDLLSTGTVSQQLPDVPTDDVQEASISSGQQKKVFPQQSEVDNDIQTLLAWAN